jgi:hypothetical protein
MPPEKMKKELLTLPLLPILVKEGKTKNVKTAKKTLVSMESPLIIRI